MEQVLNEALAVPGVTAAAVVSGDGDLLASATREPPGFDDAGSELAAAYAAARVLADSLGGPLQQTVLEYRGGPLVLAVAPHPHGAPSADVRVLALRRASDEHLGGGAAEELVLAGPRGVLVARLVAGDWFAFLWAGSDVDLAAARAALARAAEGLAEVVA